MKRIHINSFYTKISKTCLKKPLPECSLLATPLDWTHWPWPLVAGLGELVLVEVCRNAAEVVVVLGEVLGEPVLVPDDTALFGLGPPPDRFETEPTASFCLLPSSCGLFRPEESQV